MEQGWFLLSIRCSSLSFSTAHLKALVAELQPRPFSHPSLVGMEAPYGLVFSTIGSHWLTKCGGLDLAVRLTKGIF